MTTEGKTTYNTDALVARAIERDPEGMAEMIADVIGYLLSRPSPRSKENEPGEVDTQILGVSSEKQF